MAFYKKDNLLKLLGAVVFTLTLISVLPATSLAAEGGWIEGQGYWDDSSSTDSVSIMASKKPDKHWATYDYEGHSGWVGERVVAHTNWKNVNHYSRARYESKIFGVQGDSKRVWGVSKTVAYSKYVDASGSVAHTYWGN